MMLKARSAVSLVFCCLLALGMQGQTAPAPTSTETPEFEVASIHRNTASVIRWRAGFTSDGFVAEDTTLAYMLQMAYGPRQQWAKGPDWVYNARFNIEGRFDPGLYPHPTEKQRQEMLQRLLEERFHVAIHHESREYPLHLLQVGKHGPKFVESKPEEVQHSRLDGAGVCYFPASRKGYFRMQGCTMADLAQLLSAQSSAEMGRMVVDRTGLTGRYNLELRWSANSLTAAAGANQAEVPANSEAEEGPALETALREQLGLEFVPTRGQLDTIVIDHVEMPTEN